MQILHINTYYVGNPLYSHLYASLTKTGISHQIVFVPVRRIDDVGKNALASANVSIHYSHILRPWHRVLFHDKLKCSLNALYRVTTMATAPNCDVIHAHSLYSDGAIAYGLHQKYGTPYIVAIRNTDVHYYYRLMPHLRGLARRIVKDAYGIVFLSPSYKEHYFARFAPNHSAPMRSQAFVIPNGIAHAWQSPPPPRSGRHDSIHVLFLGSFESNKNIIAIIDAVEILQEQGITVSLRLVGMKHSDRYSKLICRRAKRNPHVEVFPHSTELEVIRMHYHWADVFAMVSLRETFGIVYAEALSQGVPVVYTQGEGFDGWVTNRNCGLAVSPRDPADIARCIQAAADHADPEQCIAAASQFYWTNIADQYVSLYRAAKLHE
jgi:glycosyltransferase involved in cell wall biosynthesis